MSEKLEIICPECKQGNTANLKQELRCKYCENELTDKTYIKKPWIRISATVAFLSGIGGTIGTGYYITKEISSTKNTVHHNASVRLPIDHEYLIIDSCIAQDQRPLKHSYLQNKKSICICALEKTLEVYDFSAYTNNESSFLDTFEKNANTCMEPSAAEEALPASATY